MRVDPFYYKIQNVMQKPSACVYVTSMHTVSLQQLAVNGGSIFFFPPHEEINNYCQVYDCGDQNSTPYLYISSEY